MSGMALEMESDARTTPILPPECKGEVVELIRKTVGQVARELDLTETAVRAWVKRALPWTPASAATA